MATHDNSLIIPAEKLPSKAAGITRRAILAGLPTSAVVAATAAASASPIVFTTDNADAELLAMCERYWAALNARRAVTQQQVDLSDGTAGQTPIPPIIKRSGRATGRNPETYFQRPMSEMEIHQAYRGKNRRAALVALAEWKAEHERKIALAGGEELDAKEKGLNDEWSDLCQRIWSTRAKTPTGMLAKLDLFAEPFQDLEAASVYDDLRVLCGLKPTAMGEVYAEWGVSGDEGED